MTKFCLYLPERSYSAMEKGIVFSIEEFAIHDGPGIRTTVFLKGCPLRCAWCHNPEGISPEPQYMDRRDGRTMCGYAICSGELAGKLLRNKAVYAMNRGGVTLTGGEPLLQAAFAAEVLAALQAAGVHTAVETSGYAAPDVFRRVITMDDFGGSVAGGGRYDKMIGKFTGQDTPACGFSIGFERIVMLLLENGYKVPGGRQKKAYLLEKKLPKEAMLKVLALAKADREAGRQVLIVNMKKNKKFQKEQLIEDGYTEIADCYADSVDRL